MRGGEKYRFSERKDMDKNKNERIESKENCGNKFSTGCGKACWENSKQWKKKERKEQIAGQAASVLWKFTEQKKKLRGKNWGKNGESRKRRKIYLSADENQME